MNTDREAELTQGFQVQADDNFHFVRENERWVLGNFTTYEEALSAAILNGSTDLQLMHKILWVKSRNGNLQGQGYCVELNIRRATDLRLNLRQGSTRDRTPNHVQAASS